MRDIVIGAGAGQVLQNRFRVACTVVANQEQDLAVRDFCQHCNSTAGWIVLDTVVQEIIHSSCQQFPIGIQRCLSGRVRNQQFHTEVFFQRITEIGDTSAKPCAHLVGVIESGGILALGKRSGFTESLDWGQFWWLFVSTFSVNIMLFFLWLFLSIHFENQVPALSAGMAGSLSGLFWPYALMLMGMNSNHTRDIMADGLPEFFLSAVVFLAVFFLIAAILLRKQDVKA